MWRGILQLRNLKASALREAYILYSHCVSEVTFGVKLKGFTRATLKCERKLERRATIRINTQYVVESHYVDVYVSLAGSN